MLNSSSKSPSKGHLSRPGPDVASASGSRAAAAPPSNPLSSSPAELIHLAEKQLNPVATSPHRRALAVWRPQCERPEGVNARAPLRPGSDAGAGCISAPPAEAAAQPRSRQAGAVSWVRPRPRAGDPEAPPREPSARTRRLSAAVLAGSWCLPPLRKHEKSHDIATRRLQDARGLPYDLLLHLLHGVGHTLLELFEDDLRSEENS